VGQRQGLLRAEAGTRLGRAGPGWSGGSPTSSSPRTRTCCRGRTITTRPRRSSSSTCRSPGRSTAPRVEATCDRVGNTTADLQKARDEQGAGTGATRRRRALDRDLLFTVMPAASQEAQRLQARRRRR
jgi:hypothetical protein